MAPRIEENIEAWTRRHPIFILEKLWWVAPATIMILALTLLVTPAALFLFLLLAVPVGLVWFNWDRVRYYLTEDHLVSIRSGLVWANAPRDECTRETLHAGNYDLRPGWSGWLGCIQKIDVKLRGRGDLTMDHVPEAFWRLCKALPLDDRGSSGPAVFESHPRLPREL